MKKDRWFLNGLGDAGCTSGGTLSTYHDIQGPVCHWCGRLEVDLMKAGAKWIDVFGNERDKSLPPAPTGEEPKA